MSNITKKKREQLISKLSELERYLVEHSAPDNLLQILNDAKQEILMEKYGLVFEEHIEEEAQKKAELVEERSLRIENGDRMNQLIEGENLVVLKSLEGVYTGAIDVICIDPPYNTGMTTLNYSDSEYTDSRDSYIHSKWISFMEKRLRIAHRLLKVDGVMFINIDENETGTSMLLCQQLFGDDNVDVLIWPKTDPRFDQNRVEKEYRNIKIVHEYVIVCYKNRSQTHLNNMLSPEWPSENEYEENPTQMETILKGLGTTSSAKDELDEIFGRRDLFQTPKPRRLIKEFVRVAGGKDAIVLDFFAGSGTTGHAVMDLNREDGGTRTFILVNNNENDICREITYERLKKAICEEDYSESLRYFKTSSELPG
jgi:adenine specific DNA methylase Mod